jgi:hypothetical protein
MTKSNFTKIQIKQRRIYRLAQLIYDHWEEKSGMDTRYFDHPFIHDEYVVAGRSKASGSYREHVVPRVYLRDQCFSLYDKGASIQDVAQILEKNLRIVCISTSEANQLNGSYKTKMPDGWQLGEDDPLERLHRMGICVIEPQCDTE